MKKFILINLVSIILFSCSGLQDAAKVLRNEKIKSTDEFLVKKKEPLVLPPDFSEIPEPGTLKNKKTEEDENRIKKILKTTNKSSSNDKKKSSTEKTIIDKIRQ